MIERRMTGKIMLAFDRVLAIFIVDPANPAGCAPEV
jgi:hypothetical protein